MGESSLHQFRYKRPAVLVLAFCVLPILSQCARGQLYTGSLAGTVTDQSGAVVVGAHIIVTDQKKGFSFTTTSDGAGRFVVRQLPPSQYSISAEAPGFQAQRKDGVGIAVNQNVTADFSLKIGSRGEIVDVNASGVELQTEDAVTGQVVDRRLINDLPLIDRNFTDLAFLAPGVTEVDAQCQGCYDNNFISNGSRNATADFLLDGVTASNFEQNSGIQVPTYTPSVEAVEEFKVQQSNFSAEYGFSGATIVNVVTRSGTNAFHGSAYDFLRNQALDANDWFNNFNGVPRSGLQRNNFGATIGGPIKKNKAFFFFDYDGTRENDFVSSTASVPTLNERTGNFGEVCTLQGGTFDASGMCSNPNGQLWDPYSADPTLSVPVRSQFIPFNNLATYQSPGNPVLAGTPFQPAPVRGNLIDPVARKLMQMFPAPTRATTGVGVPNWFASGADHHSDNKFDSRVDYRPSQANLLSIKYSQEKGPDAQTFNCFHNEADPCTGGPVTASAHLLSINDTHTFSPTLVLNVAYGFTRGFSFQQGITGYYPTLDPVTDLGLPAYFDRSGYKQIPAITITGYAPAQSANSTNIGTQTFSYLREGQETHQVAGTVSWLHGAHELKFGGEWRVHRINFRQPGWPGGQGVFDFSASSQNIGVDASGNPTTSTGGDGMASFLMGVGTMLAPGPCSCPYEVPNAVSTQSFQFAEFVQDNFRFRPKLTLNFGLRYEVSLPRTERYNRMDWLDPNMINPLNGGSVPGIGTLHGGEVFASPGDRYNYATDWTNLQPRFGFAYELPHGTVLRGGYGIYFSTPRSGAAGTGPWGYQGFDEQTNWIPSFDSAGILPGAKLSDPFRSYANGFPDVGPKIPPGNSLGALNDVGFSAVGPVRSISQNTPYEQAWSLGLQKELPGKLILETDYVGKKGTHLYLGGFREMDHLGPQATSLTPAQIQNQELAQVNNPFAGIITNPLSPLSAAQVPAYYLQLPFPQFTNFQGDSPPIANSIYHAAQVRLEKGFSSGLQFLVTYTFSKSIDNSSTTDDSISWLGGGVNGGTLSVPNPFNLKAERAVSTWDIPHVLQLTYVYALSFGRGKRFGAGMNRVLNAIVGGWQMNGILRFDDGRPIIPFLNSPIPIPTFNQRPDLNGTLTRSNGAIENDIAGLPNPGSYFGNASIAGIATNSGALTVPANYTFGTAPRTIPSVRQPGTRNTEMSIFKEFPLGREGRYLEYRFEAFNAFNHPHFNGPDSGVDSPTFGQITSDIPGTQRQVQMALKFYW